MEIKLINEIGINRNKEKRFESHIFTATIVGGYLENKEPDKHSDINFFNVTKLPENLGSTTLVGLKLLNYL